VIIARYFPGLERDGFKPASPNDVKYNCIAYALNDTKRWWWPRISPSASASYWPNEVPDVETIDAFSRAFATRGYETCEEVPSMEYDVIALFALNGKVKHAARRKDKNTWVSKLGVAIDIEHALQSIEGSTYGQCVKFFRRQKFTTSASPVPETY